jgi:hypothetical protein
VFDHPKDYSIAIIRETENLAMLISRIVLVCSVGLLLYCSSCHAALTADEQQEMLDLHNTARASVIPAASNMLKLVWDESMAADAQAFAATCPTGHR